MKKEIYEKYTEISNDFSSFHKWDINVFSKQVNDEIFKIIEKHIHQLYSELFIKEADTETEN